MPTRDIKESCRTSRTLAKVSAQAERLFWRLTTYADDFGRFPADADVVRANCFSVMLDTVRENHVTNWLMELSGVDLIRFYTGSDGKTYGFFPTWAKHQRTRAKHSKYPAPSSADICRQMPADVAVVTESTEVPEVAVKTETPENISRGADAPPRGIEAQVLEWLNHKAGKNFRPVEANLGLIRARLKDGLAVWQLKAIVSTKVDAWKGTEMAHYLRPSTLFNKTKCEQYVGELPAPRNGHGHA